MSAQETRELVQKYRHRHRLWTQPSDDETLAQLLITRYARLSAADMAFTGLPNVIPGGVRGTAAALGCGLAGVATNLKIQIDLCLCLVEIYRHDLPDEEKTALGLMLAVPGSAERFAAGHEAAGDTAQVTADQTARRVASTYLRRCAHQTGRIIAGRMSVRFAGSTAIKVVLLASGVAADAAAGYALTRVVGRMSVRVLEDRVAGREPQR